MNWVDLVIIIVVLLFSIEGVRRGFFVQVFDIIGFLASLIVSLFFSLSTNLIRKFLSRFSNIFVNKFLGFIPACANALLFLLFALLFVVSLPIRPDIKKYVLDSKIGSQLVDKAQFLERPFNSIFGPIAKQTLTFLTVNPKETGSIPIEFTQKQLTVDNVKVCLAIGPKMLL